ncbi:MAG: nucleoside hydrolase [Erysipelotrichaceae bacterium]|nr:nucleoside hydrolase [Erysipelotrichaceae bacterium]MBQ5804447.1 nucleoside hydrolase [Erysipelotrichaceae bacterium]
MRKIIIDTDCGSDDAVAIVMALRDQSVEILMFTTVTGNVRVDQATANTLTVIKETGTYCPPVYKGCNEMLKREWAGALEEHGNDGMGDLDLVDYSLKESQGNAVDKILEALRTHDDKEIDIITLGPLTNIAKAIMLDPETMKRANRIVMMGSSGLGEGNVTPTAEFNIWQDAEACQIVLDSGIEPLIFVGWDACLGEAMLKPEEIKMIRESGPLGKFCMDINHPLMVLNRERFHDDYLDMADPAAMAAALYPECIDICDRYYCETDISNTDTYGTLYVDRDHHTGKRANAYICSKLKAQLFKEYLYRQLKVK